MKKSKVQLKIQSYNNVSFINNTKFIALNSSSGQSLVELLLAIAIAAIVLPALVTGFVASFEGKAQTEQRLKASALLKETQEAVRNVRERSWPSFAVNGTYHPVLSGSTWSLASGSTVVNTFTQQVVISDVYRDSVTNAIVQSEGILDPSTKKIDITISWSKPISNSLTTTSYVTRYLDNLTYFHTTQADFNANTISNTSVVNNAGGEVILANNTKAKWCQPQLSSSTLDLPGVPNAVSATEGNVYVATGQTADPGQESFAHVLVSNTDPPVGTLDGKLKGYQTNAVFGEPQWGYIATTDNTKEIVIINLNQYDDAPNKIYHEQGYFNSSGSTNADTIFVYNNRGYMTAGQYLYVFNLSSKTGSRPQIGNRISFANSGDKASEIYVRETGGQVYVYIAIEGSTVDEMKIANVTNSNISSQWKIVGQINIEPNNCSTLESGKAVFVKPDGSRAYISSVNDTTFKEFFTINTSNKSNPSLVGGFATNPPCTNGGGYEAEGLNPEQSVVVSLSENRAILVGTDATGDSVDAQEYQVLDLSNEANPTKCGGLQVNQGIYGVAGVKEADGDTYAYIITGDGNAELKIIQGGPDGLYVDSGTIESPTLDTQYSTAFNRFVTTSTIPANTTIQLQFAVADPVAGSCSGASFNFVGPDGTSESYYPATGSAILLDDDNTEYENPGRCFRYRAYLSTTDYNTTPTLHDITVNYSP